MGLHFFKREVQTTFQNLKDAKIWHIFSCLQDKETRGFSPNGPAPLLLLISILLLILIFLVSI